MTTTVTIFANCQAGPMGAMLNEFVTDLCVLNTPLVHQITPDTRATILDNIQRSDVIIHQPLSATFSDLSSPALVKRFSDKTFLSFPSIFFGGFFPQLTYLRIPEHGVLWGPLNDYHDTRIIDAFLNGETQAQCLERVRSSDPGEMVYYDIALAESLKRDEKVHVPVMDIIQEEMQISPPLFTFNHPTNRVLWRVLERILRHMGNPVPNALDRLPERDFLGNTRALVPDSIPASLGLPWRIPEYSLWKDVQPMDGLIRDFYALYSGLSDFAEVAKENKDRFKLPVRLPA